ncbi:alpha-isopropylmalate synthase regulatory domain-containing protein [Tomitella cavernea]|uniref:2-isopropylmalate synthase LeuA allosteric (dimerisation) domain-containing protein n=1 Tax=Tomitella cavernea TaxID=1387982 RepID=A0ABP9D0P9_9ACTN|nr:alpha-isopropylmalate synthase regulatory domain-containing protein [Tomitella cavernea]
MNAQHVTEVLSAFDACSSAYGQAHTDGDPGRSSRPLGEFRAFTQKRSLPHPATPRAGVGRVRSRCGCRTSGLRDRSAAQPCTECRDAGTVDTCPADPFCARFGRPLPKGMRDAAAHMSWDEFLAAFRPADGPLELVDFIARRTGSARRTITARVRIGGETHTVEATGVGTVSAMTAIVYEAGYPLEINAFHQQRAGTKIATFVECSRGYQRRWAMGIGETTAESIVDACISAANRVSEVE